MGSTDGKKGMMMMMSDNHPPSSIEWCSNKEKLKKKKKIKMHFLFFTSNVLLLLHAPQKHSMLSNWWNHCVYVVWCNKIKGLEKVLTESEKMTHNRKEILHSLLFRGKGDGEATFNVNKSIKKWIKYLRKSSLFFLFSFSIYI